MDEQEDDLLAGGFGTDDDTDIPLDDDLDLGEDVPLKFDEEEEDPDSRFV